MNFWVWWVLVRKKNELCVTGTYLKNSSIFLKEMHLVELNFQLA